MKTLTPPLVQAIAEPERPQAAARWDWIDNLRMLTILLVVNMHACVTYSFVGSWYYDAPPEPSITVKIPFLFWQAHLQAFFMGLLFFIGGYYADRSLVKRGAGPFVKERLRRLGIPALLYIALLHPFIVLILHPGYKASDDFLRDYLQFWTSGRILSASGPMWFALALLLFSLILAAAGKAIPSGEPRPFRLKASTVLLISVATGVASFLIRTVQPIGSSIFNFQLCYFAQYVVVFCLGVLVSRRDWLAALANDPLAKRLGWVALVIGPLGLLGVLIASLPIPEKGPVPFMGGWNSTALGLAVWEQVVGFALALGMMAVCANRFNRRTRFSGWLSDRSFAVYLLHPPILVGLALLMQPYRTNPYVMATLLTTFGLIVSFLAADLAKRIPGLRQIL